MSRPALRRLRDFAALSGGEVIAKLAGFAGFAYLARVLGPEPYGAVELAVALVTFAALVVDAGLGPVAARDVTRDRGRAASLAAQVPALRLGLAVLALAVVGLAAGPLTATPEARRLVWIFALSLVPLAWTQNWLFQGLGRMAGVGLAQPVRMLCFAGGVVLLVSGPENLWRVGAVETAAVTAMALLYLWLQARSDISLRLHLRGGELGRVLREALPVGLSQFLWAANLYAPTLLVAALVGGAAVAWFGGSLRIVVSLNTFIWLYFFTLYPALVSASERPPEALRAVIAPSFRATAWLGIGGGLLASWLAAPLCRLAYGTQFAEAGAAFAVLVWVLPVSLLSGHARYALIAYGQQQRELASAAVGTLTVLALGVPCISRWGAVGAAGAMVAAQLGVWAVAHGQAHRHLGRLPLVGPVWRPLLAGGIALGAARALSEPGSWLGAVWLLGVYALAAPLLDRALVHDLRALRDQARGLREDHATPGEATP